MNISTVDTWLGPFTAIVDTDGAVLASGWTADGSALQSLIAPALRPATLPVPRKDLGAVTRAITAYHRGDLGAVDHVPVRQHSDGAYLVAAWKALRDTVAGAPITYTELAGRTGRYVAGTQRSAPRAAALACARNAVALFVPCHRVVRLDGTMGGFRWGVEIKRQLLAHEGTPAAAGHDGAFERRV
jgi:methylated-DNA-[protein]-cysteine S-methyltransferase